MGGGTNKRLYFTCLHNYRKTNKAATTCDASRRLVHRVQDWYMGYNAAASGKGPVNVWYLWYMGGTSGTGPGDVCTSDTKLVHVIQGCA